MALTVEHGAAGARAAALAALLACLPAHAADATPRPAQAASAAQGDAGRIAIDSARSRIGFEIRTRWGQRLRGGFPRFEGSVTRLPDATRQVHIALEVADVEIAGSPRYTAFARGEGFFDGARHPRIEFRSRPYTEALLRDGGAMRGWLVIRGIERETVFQVAPATCGRPAIDCDVVAEGEVDRTGFGMDRWRVVVGDMVRFQLRVRLDDPARASVRVGA